MRVAANSTGRHRYLGFAHSLDLWGGCLLLLELLLSEHVEVGLGEGLALGQLHACGWGGTRDRSGSICTTNLRIAVLIRDQFNW